LLLSSGVSIPYTCQVLKAETQAAPAAGGVGAVAWKAESYCNSQIFISGGDPKELGSNYHAMVAWACSNPDVLENERCRGNRSGEREAPRGDLAQPAAGRIGGAGDGGGVRR
jgi:hypothetical protein